MGSIVTTIEICNRFSPQALRNARNKISHFSNAGWSFSSFGGVEAVKRKFEAFAHKEYNVKEFTDSKHIVNCQKTGVDLFKRNIPSRKVQKSHFPRNLLDLMEQNSIFYFG